jgi:hypothetical protein
MQATLNSKVMGATPDPDQPDKVSREDVVFGIVFVLILAFAYFVGKCPA